MLFLLILLILLNTVALAELTPEHQDYIAKIESEELKLKEEAIKTEIRIEKNREVYLQAFKDSTIKVPLEVKTNPSAYLVNGLDQFSDINFKLSPENISFTPIAQIIKNEAKCPNGQHVSAWLHSIYLPRADGGYFEWVTVLCEQKSVK